MCIPDVFIHFIGGIKGATIVALIDRLYIGSRSGLPFATVGLDTPGGLIGYIHVEFFLKNLRSFRGNGLRL